MEKKEIYPGGVVLEVRDFTARKKKIRNVSFEVRAGELVGIVSQELEKLEILCRCLCDAVPLHRGRLRLNGQDVTNAPPQERKGLSFCPDTKIGCDVNGTVEENLLIQRYFEPAFQESGWRKLYASRKYARQLLARLDLDDVPLNARFRDLPPNIRQKLLLLRAADCAKDCLAALCPAQGLEDEEKEFAWRQLLRLRENRKAVLLMTDDSHEALELSDRLLVMSGGEIVAEFDPATATEQELQPYLSGARRQYRFGGENVESIDDEE